MLQPWGNRDYGSSGYDVLLQFIAKTYADLGPQVIYVFRIPPNEAKQFVEIVRMTEWHLVV